MPEQDFRGIRLIAGLGNPGGEYAGTRHNAGFLAIDSVLSRMPKGFTEQHRCKSFFWSGNYAGKRLLLQKPQTFMNLSGEALKSLSGVEQIKPGEILVIYDDMDLPLGRIRIRQRGSCGGHNGIRSIIDQLGTETFPRIRIGIGRTGGTHDGADYVLSEFRAEEQELCGKVFKAVSDAVILILRRGVTAAMNEYNSMDLNPEAASETEQEPKS